MSKKTKLIGGQLYEVNSSGVHSKISAKELIVVPMEPGTDDINVIYPPVGLTKKDTLPKKKK